MVKNDNIVHDQVEKYPRGCRWVVKKGQNISMQLLNDPMSDRPFDAGTRRWTLKTVLHQIAPLH